MSAGALPASGTIRSGVESVFQKLQFNKGLHNPIPCESRRVFKQHKVSKIEQLARNKVFISFSLHFE